MRSHTAAFLNIAVALVFAGAIMMTTSALSGTQFDEYTEIVMYSLIAVWIIPFSYLSVLAKRAQKRENQ
ncbi:MAG: hypothetical protein HOH43_22475 [Candidatus Latescibacteria bacterium]|jgi:hypothetical protein|nr:hypothetical protein [Candidatus Latescibacterota bacterium]